ncbi:hypothetical protein AVEN_263131-1 [Araneus ventricosus]|uniref:Uncharacterized protein n=1 Tax=Araneus ventricosus TaxID=182803 RepID=A0A4Y2F7N3_ARAVE|nr:hypothetical protein AVEN_263131-1 [Araneus ventricosus]
MTSPNPTRGTRIDPLVSLIFCFEDTSELFWGGSRNFDPCIYDKEDIPYSLNFLTILMRGTFGLRRKILRAPDLYTWQVFSRIRFRAYEDPRIVWTEELRCTQSWTTIQNFDLRTTKQSYRINNVNTANSQNH